MRRSPFRGAAAALTVAFAAAGAVLDDRGPHVQYYDPGAVKRSAWAGGTAGFHYRGPKPHPDADRRIARAGAKRARRGRTRLRAWTRHKEGRAAAAEALRTRERHLDLGRLVARHLGVPVGRVRVARGADGVLAVRVTVTAARAAEVARG